MDDILERILTRKAEELGTRSAALPLRELAARVVDLPPTRGFVDALEAKIAAGLPAVIAEVKKASPSKGVIRSDFDPAANQVLIAHQKMRLLHRLAKALQPIAMRGQSAGAGK